MIESPNPQSLAAMPMAGLGVPPGMTLRDYFAAQALVGLMGRAWDAPGKSGGQIISEWASSSYACADAMLKARAA